MVFVASKRAKDGVVVVCSVITASTDCDGEHFPCSGVVDGCFAVCAAAATTRDHQVCYVVAARGESAGTAATPGLEGHGGDVYIAGNSPGVVILDLHHFSLRLRENRTRKQEQAYE